MPPFPPTFPPPLPHYPAHLHYAPFLVQAGCSFYHLFQTRSVPFSSPDGPAHAMDLVLIHTSRCLVGCVPVGLPCPGMPHCSQFGATVHSDACGRAGV